MFGTCGTQHRVWLRTTATSDRASLRPALRLKGQLQEVWHTREAGHAWAITPCSPARPRGHAGTNSACSSGRTAEGAGDSTSNGTSSHLAAAWTSRLLAVTSAICSVVMALPLDAAQARHRLTADELNTINLFKESTPSVVYITNMASMQDTFTMDLMETPQGAGSGFVWDKHFIVTNYHVVKGAAELQVTLSGGEEYKAKVKGYDEDKDVAVVEIDVDDKKTKLKPIKLGTSSDLLVGQKVYAVGNPFGLDHSLSTGVISGIGREINSGITGRPIQDIIQTDAAINPGNSGGPLLDSEGYLIGVNTAIYSSSGSNSGVGFAIPADVVKTSVEQIIRFGKVVRPIIGISFVPDTASEQLGLSGILVLDAREGGPAWKVGVHGTKRDQFGRLVLGDIITGFKGKDVRKASDLYKVLDTCRVGDMVDLEVLREHSKEHITVQLAASG